MSKLLKVRICLAIQDRMFFTVYQDRGVTKLVIFNVTKAIERTL